MIPARGIILQGGAKPVPSFSRDFAGTKSLNDGIGPAISFSRGSNATYFDGTGTLQYADNNGIRNSEGVGAVAGTPGTVPTNWSFPTADSGLSRQIVGTGAANGFNYLDIRYSGTTTAASGFGILFESTAGIPSFFGQTGNTSVSLAVVAGSVSNLGRVGITVQEWAGGSNVATSRASDLRGALTSTLQRFNYTATFSNATTTNSIPLVEISFSTGIVVDFTLRISAPQYQVGVSSPTDYKPTTGTAYYGPRFDHDPVTLQSKGLLIEESRTNLLCYSNDLTKTTAWNTTQHLIPTAAGTGIDGLTANRLTEDTAVGNHMIIAYGGNASANAMSYTSGTTYTWSAYLKKGIGATAPDWVQLAAATAAITPGAYCNFNLTTGAVGASTNCTGSIQAVGNGWYRCVIVGTANATATSDAIRISGTNNNNTLGRLPSYTGSSTSDFYCCHAQVEVGTFATSPIPTGTATATRAADVANVTGSDFSNLYQQNQGSFFVAYYPPPQPFPTNRFEWVIGVGPSSERFSLLNGGSSTSYSWQAFAGNVFIGGSGNLVQQTFNKTAAGYSSGGISIGFNGVFNTAMSAVNITTTTKAGLGIGQTASGGSQLCCWISSLAYYPKRLSDRQLIALTR